MKERIKTLLKLGIMAAIVMHLANKAIESSSLVRNLLKTHEGDYFNWKNGRIYYRKTGDGSPLLLIHDLYPSSSSQEWSQVIETLAKKHTVYTLDLLGCGRSDKPNITYTNYLYVLMVSDFIQEIIGEQTDVIATGKSGSFVIMAASINKNLFGKITLVNPESLNKLDCIPDDRSKVMKFLMDMPILGTSIFYLMNSENQIEYDFSERYFYNPFHLDTKLLHSYYESAHLGQGGGRHLLASLQGSYVNNSIRAALPKLDNNIFLVFGNEMENAKNIGSSYIALSSNVHMGLIEKTKMLPQLEAPDKFISIIR